MVVVVVVSELQESLTARRGRWMQGRRAWSEADDLSRIVPRAEVERMGRPAILPCVPQQKQAIIITNHHD